ncbi:hypothetical protein TGAMA5MH_11044 [Trichoderma gamsii]|uniref:AB hydrolase-1 domain-containing protein n=1 Tax=Trichoderma gamsii TaxID=398673 RepID=A0A2K0SUX8_9HYPO|nr:hypothetical protein TGAMA5MH_11044 [Trichoderma gamsii]
MSSITETITLNDGTNIRVKLLGDKHTDRPLLIALHGAPGLSSLNEPLASFAFLADRLRVLVYDARGSGKSDSQGPLADEQWISDLDEIRAWAGVETFILAGGSYGGFLALGYALTYPNRLSGLILRNTWACGFKGSLRILKNICISPRIRPDLDRQVRLWSGNVRDNEDGARGLEEILAIYTPAKENNEEEGPGNFEGAGNDFEMRWEVHNAAWSLSVPRFDVRNKLHQIETPTLIIAGRHDPICPVEDSEEIHQGIPESDLVIFEKSGHNPSADEPLAVQKALKSFLGKVFENI